MVVVGFMVVVFGYLFWKVSKIFDDQNYESVGKRGRWQFIRYRWAYILMLPALLTIAIWAYYPLARGTLMAFQDYNIRGFSRWIGFENFAAILRDPEFWFSLWVTLKYATLYMCFGFTAPIVLAFLLTEVPQGKTVFRSIYYLPAVLSGVIVIFLWKGFYDQYGPVNQIINFVIDMLNYLPGVQLEHTYTRWLESPGWVLFFCLLPNIWVAMGPGCLIYLAALKTVPDDLYEAADIDGAGIRHKVFHVALPQIRMLIVINFVGAMVGCMKGSGELMLAMTGRGPLHALRANRVDRPADILGSFWLSAFWYSHGHGLDSGVAADWFYGDATEEAESG